MDIQLDYIRVQCHIYPYSLALINRITDIFTKRLNFVPSLALARCTNHLECLTDMLQCVTESVLFAGIVLHQVVTPSSTNYLVIDIRDVHDVDDIIVEV